jgi:hypothetical protein
MVGDVVSVDLIGATSEEALIAALGRALQFGGPMPEDNICATDAPDDNRGYGFNWNAVIDCFRYVGEGGIWGTSRAFNFPLSLLFINSTHLSREQGSPLQTMMEVLKIVADEASADGRLITYDFQ